FETGPVFKKAETPTGVEEPTRVAVALCSDRADYTKAKQVLESLFEAIGVKALYEETHHDSFINGRVARVKVNNKDVAYVGEIHPEVLCNFNLELPVSAFELNLTDLMEVINV
ncbi:phenylalanine--tRNA ligase subunit beta, partial [Nanoarchaeota archaeon]